MTMRRPIRARCFLVALVYAWVVAIFVPSAIIAAAALSPAAEDRNLAAAIFEVADEVAPAAKIGFALLLAPLLLAARRFVPGGARALALDIVAALAAMLLIVALLPAAWSRGFGIGLAGVRFDPTLLAIYLAGAAGAGLVFALYESRCLARRSSGRPAGRRR